MGPRAVNQEALLLRLKQEAERSARTDRAVPGRFVAGDERQLAVACAKSAGVLVAFEGGFAEAERVQVCFYPPEETPYFSFVWVQARWNGRFCHVEHRDLLGSLMALGIDRAYFGDLVIEADSAYLCVMPEIAPRLPVEWEKAGNAPLKVTVLDEPPALTPPQGELLRDTVAALRLDCLVSSGMRVSRAKAAEIIRQGAVSVAHVPEERVDRLIEPGQLLSVRGFGRIRLVDAGAPTRKDRLPVRLEIFKKG